MTTMNAERSHRFGGPEVLTLEDAKAHALAGLLGEERLVPGCWRNHNARQQSSGLGAAIMHPPGMARIQSDSGP